MVTVCNNSDRKPLQQISTNMKAKRVGTELVPHIIILICTMLIIIKYTLSSHGRVSVGHK